MGTLNVEFKEAFQYVANFKGIDVHSSKPKGIIRREKENTDLVEDFLVQNKVSDNIKEILNKSKNKILKF
jgi:ribosome-associated translation inhibitor RaiA